VRPRIAADDDRATDLRPERGPERAHRRIIEIAVRDATDIVLTKYAGVHRS